MDSVTMNVPPKEDGIPDADDVACENETNLQIA